MQRSKKQKAKSLLTGLVIAAEEQHTSQPHAASGGLTSPCAVFSCVGSRFIRTANVVLFLLVAVCVNVLLVPPIQAQEVGPAACSQDGTTVATIQFVNISVFRSIAIF